MILHQTSALSCSTLQPPSVNLRLATTETRENFGFFLLSTIKAYFSCRNLVRTPTKLLLRSGPWSNLSFKECHLNEVEQSNTTHIFVGFLQEINSMMQQVPGSAQLIFEIIIYLLSIPFVNDIRHKAVIHVMFVVSP